MLEARYCHPFLLVHAVRLNVQFGTKEACLDQNERFTQVSIVVGFLVLPSEDVTLISIFTLEVRALAATGRLKKCHEENCLQQSCALSADGGYPFAAGE